MDSAKFSQISLEPAKIKMGRQKNDFPFLLPKCSCIRLPLKIASVKYLSACFQSHRLLLINRFEKEKKKDSSRAIETSHDNQVSFVLHKVLFV